MECALSLMSCYHAMYHNLVRSQQENFEFCKKLGSDVAVANNEKEWTDLAQLYSVNNGISGYFFLGFVRVGNVMVDINNLSFSSSWDSHAA